MHTDLSRAETISYLMMHTACSVESTNERHSSVQQHMLRLLPYAMRANRSTVGAYQRTAHYMSHWSHASCAWVPSNKRASTDWYLAFRPFTKLRQAISTKHRRTLLLHTQTPTTCNVNSLPSHDGHCLLNTIRAKPLARVRCFVASLPHYESPTPLHSTREARLCQEQVFGMYYCVTCCTNRIKPHRATSNRLYSQTLGAEEIGCWWWWCCWCCCCCCCW
jgi:hypothetical protein